MGDKLFFYNLGDELTVIQAFDLARAALLQVRNYIAYV